MLYVVLMGIMSLCVALFAVQNSMKVEVDFLFWTFTTSLVLVVITCFVFGLLVAFCWGLKLKASHYLKERKTKGMLDELTKKNQELEAKIARMVDVKQQDAAVDPAHANPFK